MLFRQKAEILINLYYRPTAVSVKVVHEIQIVLIGTECNIISRLSSLGFMGGIKMYFYHEKLEKLL